MRVMLAGGDGGIGSQLYKYLANNNVNVTSVGIQANENDQREFYYLDLTDQKEIGAFIKDQHTFSALVFLTGLAHSKGKGAEYDKFYSINVQTLINLLEEMKSQDKLPDQIIFSSTISVYGEKFDVKEYGEDCNLSPKSPYAKTKVEAENYLLNNYGERCWILRFSPVYTPDFNLNIERRTKIRNIFYRVGRGNNKLSLLSIENINKVVLNILEGKIPQDIYNLSDNIEYSFDDLLKFMSAKKVLFIPSFIIRAMYLVNKVMGNNFIEENSIKLLTDNVYPSAKISKFVELKSKLFKTV